MAEGWTIEDGASEIRLDPLETQGGCSGGNRQLSVRAAWRALAFAVRVHPGGEAASPAKNPGLSAYPEARVGSLIARG